MKWSRNRSFFPSRVAYVAITLGAACAASFYARAELAPWLQSVVSGSAIEAALYRAMDLPGVKTLYPRPPAEARGELSGLLKGKPDAAQLYALRAHSEEQALDFSAAEQDWKAFVARSADKQAAEFELADFYHRRVAGAQEIAALEQAASAPAAAGEKFIAADKQRAWGAFARALIIAQEQALGDDATVAIHRAWITRYPAEPAVRADFVSALMKMRRYGDAQQAIADYRTAFPQDHVFPIKATALVALQQGDAAATTQALGLFDKAYQPLWPAELVQTYFQLLSATHTQHTMLADAQARLLQNPDDYSAATRIFFYYQQQGRSDAAANTLAEYGASKESRHAAWTADELYTFAALLDNATQYEEAARYYYALAGTQGKLTATTQTPEEAGLSSIIRILLASPDRPIDLGSGNLSIYRDLATLDQGPGYLNGILSLWFNSANPASEFHDEEVKATPYFHRAKAAELLAVLDQRFPASSTRPALHAALIRAYITYGQDDAVRKAGQQFLVDFPHAEERLEVASEVADVDARQNDTKAEFALYEGLLAELSGSLQGMPLTAAGAATTPVSQAATPTDDQTSNANGDNTQTPTASAAQASAVLKQSLTIPVAAPATTATAEAYRQILDRYLSRLTTVKELPAALAVLRRELDRNPNDPLLYARLADFLQQNNLAAEQEAVYQQAIARFNDTGFYDKLARFYLREKRQQDFDALTHKVVDIFQGTELEQYFGNVSSSWPQEYLQLNLYAHKRFPHDLTFTNNLLSAYLTKDTYDAAAWEQLMREHWLESPELQAQFFSYLSRTNGLDKEMASLEALVPAAAAHQQNPAATRELAQLQLWRSHFEESAPLLGSLAELYPADTAVGEDAASVFRSLAYYDPAQIEQAVAIERHLSEADPANLDRLATIGDMYADSTAASLNLSADHQIAQAAPYWRRMSAVHPGLSDGYLQSATVFWDYFQFDDAVAQIEAARKQFHNPALYGYEAGAIYENKRDYARAVDEYVRAATAGDTGPVEDPSSSARARLLTLATRQTTGELVDQATSSSLAQHPTLAALELRVDVLKARQQPDAIGPAVEAAIPKAASVEDAAQLAELSQSNQLPLAYQAALQREIALAIDPVQRIELQYQLVRAYEDQKDTASAQRVIEAVYKDNKKILGVVRATTDFYWDNKQPQRAVATLVQASHDANPALAHDFTLEAAAKSSQSGDSAGARALLKPLLTADPYNEQYLHLYADSYTQAHDAAGVRDFYATTLTSLQSSNLSKLEKRDKIALARQGMIAALTDLKDYSGALDQHIALISAFPEDAEILQSAASYARLHSREQQLVTFLNKTVADSPRDSRFAIDLGRVDVLFEDYDGALAAYSKAIAIRKDRPELYIARADLEEHQQSFDAVCADYDRLYFLTYKDPQWMEKAALARARQGRADLAVKALQTAWIEGRPASAANNFRVAEQLTEWDMLTEARKFGDEGVKLAGDELLTNTPNANGAVQYANLLGRQRQAEQALSLLEHARAAANVSPSSPAVVIKQVEEKGIASVTDAEWRKQLVEQRRQFAQNSFQRAVQELSTTAADYYTPEEKLAYARLLDTKRANASLQEVVDVWIPAAQAAELKDREATWRRDVLLGADKDLAAQQLQPFNDLEAQRMDNLVRAQTLDAYAATLPHKKESSALSMAASAWRDAGDFASETRDLRKLVLSHLEVQHQQRLFQLLLQHNPSALIPLAASKGSYADAAANYAIANGSKMFAYQVVAARAARTSPGWLNATNALLGLYFADTSPRTNLAFQTVLANGTIGERLQGKPDEEKQVTGDPWFYYAMRYGVLRTIAQKPDADSEEYLAAGLELKPQSSESYSGLAQAYVDAHKYDAAIAEYRHVEELDPTDPEPNRTIAEVLWTEGHHDEALAEWNKALTKLREMIDEHSVPESFWTCFSAIANDAHDHQIVAKLKPGMNAVLESYIRKNGSYRAVELLHAAYIALDGQSEAVDWVLALTADTTEQRSLLSSLTAESWFPHKLLGNVYRREIALAQAEAEAAKPKTGEENETQSEIVSIQTRYLKWMLEQDQIAEAQRLLESIPATQREGTELEKITLLLAARQSRLPQLLASYKDDPTSAPTLDTLSSVANQLRLKNDNANSRLLLEYVFQQKTALQELAAADYLALAEARLATDDVPGALDLLHRLTLQGDLYENLNSAAELLMKTGHVAEALPMLAKLSKGTPWDQDYQRQLGEALLEAKQTAPAVEALSAVAASSNTGYDNRATAAEELHAVPGTYNFNSAELTLLANATPSTQQADQPYFAYSRIDAANALPAAQRAETLRAAILIAPAALVDTLRLEIFRSEIAATHYEQADMVIAPLLNKHADLRFVAQDASSGEDDSSGSDTYTADDGEEHTYDPGYPREDSSSSDDAPVLSLNPAEKHDFVLMLATMEEHTAQEQQAIRDLQTAALLTDDKAQTLKIEGRIQVLQYRLTMQQENATRRPVIQKSVEQTVLVRPRLTASTAKVQP